MLTDVLVLAAGTKLEQPNDKEKPVAVTVVTLLVDPDEAERLTLASNEGKIQLALRNPLDRARPVTHGVRPALLIGTDTTRAPGIDPPDGVGVHHILADAAVAAGAAGGVYCRDHPRRQARARNRARAGVI